MAYVKENVYVLTAFFKEDCYTEPSEEFYARTFEEAEKKQAELLESDEYEDVMISDEMQEREFWYTKEELEARSREDGVKLNDKSIKMDIHEEMDMLRGNLNRMCVTDDVQELDSMKEWAEKRIQNIYNARLEHLMQENAEKLDKMHPITEESPNAQYRPTRRGR